MTDLHGNAVGIKKEDNGAQEKSFPDPIVLFVHDVNSFTLAAGQMRLRGAPSM
jgi:hypothetical protein